MNFATLNKIKTTPKKEEFDVKKFLDQRSRMTYQVDSYFINEPIPLVDSALEFDFLCDFNAVELEDSLINIVKTHC